MTERAMTEEMLREARFEVIEITPCRYCKGGGRWSDRGEANGVSYYASGDCAWCKGTGETRQVVDLAVLRPHLGPGDETSHKRRPQREIEALRHAIRCCEYNDEVPHALDEEDLGVLREMLRELVMEDATLRAIAGRGEDTDGR